MPLRPTLNVDDRAYADGLLLKLDRLVRDQILPTELETILPVADTARPLLVDQPVQELGVSRHAPVVALALCDKQIEVFERLHVHRRKTGDFRETLDFFASQPYVIAEAEHRALVMKTPERTIFAQSVPDCL